MKDKGRTYLMWFGSRILLISMVVSFCCGCDEEPPNCPDESYVLCGNKCTDLKTDSYHCGECDNACRPDERCYEGSCMCPTRHTDCNGVCVDLDGNQVCRELVEDTKGFCRTYGVVDDSCESVTDCIGYRIPVPTGPCCSDEYVRDLDCAFANRHTFPVYDECTADEECRRAPRACIEGRCVLDMPEDTCETDEDCVLLETGCACMPASSTIAEYMPAWGQDCTGMTSCPPADQAFPLCIGGYCHIAGPFMDPDIGAYCICLSGDGSIFDTFDECVEAHKEDRYELAAIFWRIIRTMDIVGSCLGLLMGPWQEITKCIAVLCP